ncbi:MAG: hypothetical protein JWQ73_2438 [Variovorax sp.]|nr:hypothetical protein [Variovorax sp.]
MQGQHATSPPGQINMSESLAQLMLGAGPHLRHSEALSIAPAGCASASQLRGVETLPLLANARTARPACRDGGGRHARSRIRPTSDPYDSAEHCQPSGARKGSTTAKAQLGSLRILVLSRSGGVAGRQHTRQFGDCVTGDVSHELRVATATDCRSREIPEDRVAGWMGTYDVRPWPGGRRCMPRYGGAATLARIRSSSSSTCLARGRQHHSHSAAPPHMPRESLRSTRPRECPEVARPAMRSGQIAPPLLCKSAPWGSRPPPQSHSASQLCHRARRGAGISTPSVNKNGRVHECRYVKRPRRARDLQDGLTCPRFA